MVRVPVFLCKKRLFYIVNLNSMQFCMDFFLERIDLASFFGISINNERLLMAEVKIFNYHFIYTFIFTTISYDN